jgi:hypothetical protein
MEKRFRFQLELHKGKSSNYLQVFNALKAAQSFNIEQLLLTRREKNEMTNINLLISLFTSRITLRINLPKKSNAVTLPNDEVPRAPQKKKHENLCRRQHTSKVMNNYDFENIFY